MRNVVFLIFSLFAAASLSGCKSPELDVSPLGKKLPAPSLKGTNPFQQDMDLQNYVRIQGACDTRIGNIFLSFDKTTWHQPPANPDVTGSTLSNSTVNDRNCSDGVFDIYLTKNDLLNIWGIQSGSSDIHSMYLKGETLIGDSETLVVNDPKQTGPGNPGPYDPAPNKLTLEKMWPRSYAGASMCESLRVNVVNKDGYRVVTPTAINFSIEEQAQASKALGAFLNWQECNNGAAPTQTVFTVPANSDGVDIVYRFPDGPYNSTLKFRILSPSSLIADTAYTAVTIRDSGPYAAYRWLSVEDSPSQIYKNLCYPLRVRSYLYNHSWAYETGTSVSFNSTNSQLKFYSDASCASQNSSFSFSASSDLIAYVKYSPLGSETESFKNFTITVTGSSATYTYDSNPIEMRVDLTSKAVVSSLDIWGPRDISRGTCHGFRVVSMNENGTLLPANTTIPVALGTVENGAGEFYADATCTATPASLITIAAGSSSSMVYFKTASLAEGTYHFKISASGLTARSPEFIVTPAPTQLKIIAPTDLTAGSCKKISVGLTDAGGSVYPAPYNIAVNLYLNFSTMPSGDRFFSDATCSTHLISNSVIIPAGTQQSAIYVNSDGLNGITLYMSANTTGLMSDSLNITFQ